MRVAVITCALAPLAGCSPTATPPIGGSQDAAVPEAASLSDAGAGKVALGAFILDRTSPVLGEAPADPAAMTNYAAMVGGNPAIIMWYVKWERPFPTTDLENVAQLGATPMLTWEACDPPDGGVCQTTASSAFTDKNIVAGMFDSFVTAWAAGAKAWGKPFFLRALHEMNGNWYPWATGAGNPNQNAPADYIAAWKHLHQLLDAAGVTNATWVWCPNVGSPLAADYPGDAWVDWVALDGYNGGSVTGNWTSFKDLFAASYAELTSLTSKPTMFAETASAPSPGDKAAWITQGFLGDLPASFPRVRAVIWFDMSKETDWRVNSSAASLAAWRSVVQTPYFQAGPPL
jgi:hypothetical protein